MNPKRNPPSDASVPWVLLRGLGREAAHWGDFPKRLSAELGGQEVICLDLPGAGLRHKEPAPLSVPEMAADVLRTVHHRLGGRVRILGQSLGALVALEAARQAPTAVAAVVLVNPILSAVKPLLRLPALTLEPSLYEREVLLYGLTSSLPPDHARISQWETIQRQRGVGRGTLMRQIIAAARYRAPRGEMPTPLLFLLSQADALADPAQAIALARTLDAPVKIHQSAGHDMALDAGDFLAQAVARWMGHDGH